MHLFAACGCMTWAEVASYTILRTQPVAQHLLVKYVCLHLLAHVSAVYASQLLARCNHN